MSESSLNYATLMISTILEKHMIRGKRVITLGK